MCGRRSITRTRRPSSLGGPLGDGQAEEPGADDHEIRVHPRSFARRSAAARLAAAPDSAGGRSRTPGGSYDRIDRGRGGGRDGTPDGHGSVAAVVVTYNRQDYLGQLLPTLLARRRPLDAIYVVDNASTDGTDDFLAEHYGDEPPSARPARRRTPAARAGSTAGVVPAYNDGHDWFWLMDDDVTALPDGIEGLLRFSDRSGCIHGRRVDFHGGAVLLAAAHQRVPRHPAALPQGPVRRRRGGVRDELRRVRGDAGPAATSSSKIGPPDPRFFITWDDAVYALVASRVTQVTYVDHFSLNRQREQRQASLAVRHLNDASDLFRFHVMRNRGYMAHYLRHLGAYNASASRVGTPLTFAKEVLRLVYVEHSLHGTGALLRGLARVPPDTAPAVGADRHQRARRTPPRLLTGRSPTACLPGRTAART